ncbi:uncharacterized protein DUF1963 [Maribacter vaceletii]|uniref:Uncharacterized protein DUF1963 n=1 Tax=Maribacter vaceletii TaxID=1206816 RepID=A0A495EB47_9FLAO|nr:DUF1963 domain-containing protein [Maribacter vaceletii]RKR14046.1 uncharacterized protein DUF1963 [Maribacter vaceletii]
MRSHVTDLFKIDLPNAFEIFDSSKVGIWANNKTIKYKNQWPIISVAVLKLSDLFSSNYLGSTWQEKFQDSCLSVHFKSEKICGKNKKINDLDAFLIKAHTDAVFRETHFNINYFFAGILLDDDYYIEFKVVHEKNEDGQLQEWVMQTFESLKILGDKAHRQKIWEEHLLEIKKEEEEYQEKLKVVTATSIKPEQKIYDITIPADGKEYITVGNFKFQFIKEDCKAIIAKMSKELVVTISAKTKEFKKAIADEVLDDYPGDGRIEIVIPAKGIHKNGLPDGQLLFNEGKTNAPLFLHSRLKGFNYRLDFNGTVIFKKGWLLMAGEMTKSYHNKSFPIQLAKKMEVESLNWSNYQFISLKETETASPNDVCFLNLENPNFVSFPKNILAFKNLESLSISQRSNNWQNQKLPLKEVPKEISKLTKLKTLHFSGTSIQELPKAIGKLTNLEQLSLGNNLLFALPNGVWQLPKLKNFWVSNNKITNIPNEIKMPELQNISLDGNLLKTLPKSLAKQSKLGKINLNKNPLESLPSVYNTIKVIELSIEDKKRLLDYDYKGADGKGLVSWDNTIFYAKNDKELVSEIEKVIVENKLEKHKKALLSVVKKSVSFTHEVEEDYANLGNHRFGGMPDLPEEVPYPRFGDNWRENKTNYIYEFIGQINCSQITHLQDYLPRKGILFFFLETLHTIYGGDSSPGKIIYIEDESTLKSGKRFKFSEEDYYEMVEDSYQGYKVNVKKINSAPSFYASYVNTHLFKGEDAKKLQEDEHFLEDLYDLFEEPLQGKNKYNYAVNAHAFTQHEAPELQASLNKKGNPEDWITLLTVTSAGDMQWGDAGDLFFVIHKSDLEKCNFSNVFITMESS